MPAELDDLVLDEVSFVDEPANKGSRILLMKRKNGFATIDSDDAGLVARLKKILGIGEDADLTKEVEDVPKIDPAVEKRLEELADQVQKLSTERDAGELATAIAAALKSDAPAEQLAELEKQVAELAKKGGDDKDARIAELEKQLADAKTSAEAARKASDELAAFRGRLPKALQKAFDDLDEEERRQFMGKFSKGIEKSDDPLAKALADVTKTNAELTTRLEKMEHEVELEKVREELSGVRGLVDFDKTVGLVTKLRASDPAAADALVAELKGAAEKAKAADLFKTLGKDGGGSETSVDSRINKAVRAYRDANPTASEAVAMTKVLEAQPELYAEYRAEQEGR